MKIGEVELKWLGHAGFLIENSKVVYIDPYHIREGLPKALIEAMSQSVPPIGSLAGGIPEIIEDGVSGFLVPPRDASAIAAKITELASNRDRAREIGRNARARIEKSFNILTTVERMKQILTST